MAAVALRRQNETTKQQIYERHMNQASNHFSKQVEFDINKFSEKMREIYLLYMAERRENSTESYSFYVMRNSNRPMVTFIDDLSYEGLHTIFEEHFPSIFKSDPYRKLNNIPDVKSPLNYIKYVESMKGFQLSNKYLHHITNGAYSVLKKFEETGTLVSARRAALNTSKKRQHNTITDKNTITHNNIVRYNKLQSLYDQTNLIRINTTIPIYNKKKEIILYSSVPTSGIRLYLRTKSSWTNWGSFVYTFRIFHTDINICIYILYCIKSIWEKLQSATDNKPCYQIHWLLAIACPFQRGSAGFAKVMLNAALLKIGLAPVRETAGYQRKTDWVAIFSPTFEEYYEKVPQMFEDDPNFQVQDSSATKPGGYRKKARCTRKKYKN